LCSDVDFVLIPIFLFFQAVLLNLLLRNYLHYNLVEQAQTLASKTTFPENASNNQFCRYLFSMGRIQAIQLEYSEAYLRLTTAARKAPQDDSAKGFAITVHKLTVIVQLLMGEIQQFPLGVLGTEAIPRADESGSCR
jgi:26S proteasome regulatory subunit N3